LESCEEEADEAEELEVVRPCVVGIGGGALGGGRPGDNRCVRRDCILSAQSCGAQEDSIVEESKWGTGEGRWVLREIQECGREYVVNVRMRIAGRR
jgi:hypothetical protein